MRWSKALIPTVKETPADAEVLSHKLLVRAGFIKQIAAGSYAFLPLAWRVMKKINRIICEEMDAIGGQEIFMPSLSPASLWEESGRWQQFGPDMFRLKDRKDRDYALAPTHEEVISDIARKFIKSYKDLPQIWYQIQNKFRDEPRPRAGLLRVREFLMKDSYSLDSDQQGLDRSYQLHRDAYIKIFTRCGLPFSVVKASSGLMGGSGSEEFMVVADAGEDTIVKCSSCDYSANTEVAQAEPVPHQVQSPYREVKKVHTPGVRTAQEVAQFLGVDTSLIIKTLVYFVGQKVYAVLIRGDQQLCDEKLASALGGEALLATEQEVRDIFGADIGFVGPVGMRAKLDGIIADNTVKTVPRGVVGANENDYHLTGVVPGQDFEVDSFADLRLVKHGDACPVCGAPVKIEKAIEVGHIFKLGTRYSKSMGVEFADRDGQLKPVIMGSYGIGLGRIMLAAAEVLSDEKGLCWPVSIAPFQVSLVDISGGKFSQEADQLYNQLLANGIEVIYDDRDVSPGVKFKDSELIGFPVMLVMSLKKMSQKTVELQVRKTGQKRDVPLGEVVNEVKRLLQEI